MLIDVFSSSFNHFQNILVTFQPTKSLQMDKILITLNSLPRLGYVWLKLRILTSIQYFTYI